jgi:cytochrome c553
MIAIAQALTDAETRAAAEYFASIKFTPWVKVVETNTVPKFMPTLNGLFQQTEGTATEPLGKRLIELPEKRDDTFLLRNPRSGFIAYVPVSSIAKGEALVTMGGAGKTVRCGICHGPDLRGIGPVPAIAGRQASYIVRQLHDMQQGTRKGMWAALMKAAVANLSEEEMLQIAAYTASRVP